jgi:ribosomal protein L36
VPYYSIPEFPSDCRIVKRHGIVARDVLLCNPTNFHVQGGVQYDPHVETMEYINCQPRVRRSISEKMKNYDDVRILFRTRRLRLDGGSDELVTGYYVVGSASEVMCRDAPVIMASGIRFVTDADAIDITSLMDREKAHRSSFTTGNSKWKPYLLRWIRQLDKGRDATEDYKKEIQRLKMIYKNNEFRLGDRYGACRNCSEEDQCFLVRRRKRYGCLEKCPPHFR